MKFFATIFMFLICFAINGQKLTKDIFGIVTDGRDVVIDAVVTNRNSEEVSFTDNNGKYNIRAHVGDVIQFSFVGMKTKQVTVEDVTRILNVTLRPEITMLDEVTVTERLSPQEKLEKDYEKNKGIVRTFYGFRDVLRIGGRVVDMEQNTVPYSCLIDLLRVKFPRLTILGTCGSLDPSIYSRGLNSIMNPRGVMFEVDGHLISQIPEIPVWDIKRIAVLNDAFSALMFGVGGVIVINTYGYTPKPPTISEKLGLSNVFAERSNIDKINTLDSKPYYLDVFEKAKSTKDAKDRYDNFKTKYFSSPYFFLDTYEYFYDKGEVNFADSILDDTFKNLFNKNPVILKALAYIYQEQGRFNKANEIYRQVFILRPNYMQSYYDLANSYREIGDYSFAAELYTRYNYLVQEGFFQLDTANFHQLIKKDFSNLIALNSNKLSFGKNAERMAAKKFSRPSTRIIFEWNDSQAEFNLEFLKDNSEYYVWKHNYDESPEDINNEKKYGYSISEYVIEGDKSSGTWQVNLNYLGNMSLTPTYLKTTIYYNYGYPSQHKEVKVFKLDIKNINQNLFKIYNQTVSITVN